MSKYKNLHLWLLIPLVIALLGFMPSYWLRFADAPWRQHIHGITATAWFILLILQPYLITRGNVRRHRQYGMFALVLAGGVVVSGLGLIPYNLVNDRLPESARYGLSFIDIVLMPGFAVAVFMAIKNSKSIEDHSRWMISTVFWAISPGLFRLLFIPLVIAGTTDLGSKAPLLLTTSGIANIVVLLFLMYRDRRAHPAYVAAAVGSLVLFVPMQVGEMDWWRSLADALFTI